MIAWPVEVRGGVLHPDLAYVEEKIAIDYEGDHHRVDRTTWQRDLQRRERLEDAGWRHIRVTANDVFGDSRELINRVRAALRSRALRNMGS